MEKTKPILTVDDLIVALHLMAEELRLASSDNIYHVRHSEDWIVWEADEIVDEFIKQVKNGITVGNIMCNGKLSLAARLKMLWQD
jgi:hypothetical protein